MSEQLFGRVRRRSPRVMMQGVDVVDEGGTIEYRCARCGAREEHRPSTPMGDRKIPCPVCNAGRLCWDGLREHYIGPLGPRLVQP